MTPQERAELDNLLTTRTPEFENWLPQVNPSWDWQAVHIRFLLAHLRQVTDGQVRRLMLFMPPRHAKSETVTVRYSVWNLERNPHERVIIGAYNQVLANLFSRKARRIARLRGFALADDKVAVDEWETSAGGGFKAVGVGSGVTGRGGELIVIDDPVKSREEAESQAYRDRVYDWYTNDLYTRLEPHGKIICIMTRWHDDDLAGRILAGEDGPNWKVVSLPAIAEADEPPMPDGLGRKAGEPLWPARFDLAALEETRRVLGSSWYALYQQRPQAAEGAIFKRDWFRYVDRLPDDLPSKAFYFDTAYGEKETQDYSTAVIVGRDKEFNYYVVPVMRERREFPDLVALALHVRNVWKVPVKVENKASGKSLVQSLRKLGVPAIELDPGGKDKVARAYSITEWFESGKVFFVRHPLLPILEDELLRFPSAKHDDLVDAMVMGLRNQTTTEYASPLVHDRGGFR